MATRFSPTSVEKNQQQPRSNIDELIGFVDSMLQQKRQAKESEFKEGQRSMLLQEQETARNQEETYRALLSRGGYNTQTLGNVLRSGGLNEQQYNTLLPTATDYVSEGQRLAMLSQAAESTNNLTEYLLNADQLGLGRTDAMQIWNEQQQLKKSAMLGTGTGTGTADAEVKPSAIQDYADIRDTMREFGFGDVSLEGVPSAQLTDIRGRLNAVKPSREMLSAIPERLRRGYQFVQVSEEIGRKQVGNRIVQIPATVITIKKGDEKYYVWKWDGGGITYTQNVGGEYKPMSAQDAARLGLNQILPDNFNDIANYIGSYATYKAEAGRIANQLRSQSTASRF